MQRGNVSLLLIIEAQPQHSRNDAIQPPRLEVRLVGQGRVALHYGRQKINLHEFGRVLDANVRHATPCSADFCLLTDTPVEEVLSQLSGCGARIIEGPVSRTGAAHALRSVYFYDPDENLIEVAREVQRPTIHRPGAEA
jgi:catechol 2,3-dioxygenase-like lactoylglutathione lyase family enzyme